MEAQIDVEVCGAHLGAPEIALTLDGMRFRYVADPGLKQGRGFRFGAFFSKAVLSEEVGRYPREQRIAVLAESPIDRSYSRIDEVVRRFPIVFTHQRRLLELGGPFQPLHFGTNWIGVTDRVGTQAIAREHPSKQGLVSFIGSLEHPDSGAYRFRREVAECLLRRDDVDCFGRGIRPVQGKREAIAPYRFSVAMENAAADDYFSEKLIDCLLLETIPIYYGWPSIAEHLDARGILVFRSVEELGEILEGLTPALYEQMRPFALANKEQVLARRWHSHEGMLERLSEQLPSELLHSSPIPFRLPSRTERFVRRLFGNLKS
jgi:hypothetical protein